MPLQMHISPIFQWCHIQAWCEPRPLKALTQMPPPKIKKELQAFLRITNYLCKFFCGTADVCESLRQLISTKTEWTWNATYQKPFDKAKSIITEDACTKFYDESQLLYLATDASGIELGTALLQIWSSTSCPGDKAPNNSTLRPIAFSSESLSSAERRYSNIEREALGVLQGHEKCQHYYFAREVSIITNWHITNNYKHSRYHDITAITTCNLTRWSPTATQRLYHQRLAREQRSNTTRHENISDISRWYDSDQWGYTLQQTLHGVIKKRGIRTPC